MQRRGFLLAVASAIVGQRLAAKWWPKPTTGGLFNPHSNLYAEFFGSRRKIGDTILIRKPPRFQAYDGFQWKADEFVSMTVGQFSERYLAPIHQRDAAYLDWRAACSFNYPITLKKPGSYAEYERRTRSLAAS